MINLHATRVVIALALMFVCCVSNSPPTIIHLDFCDFLTNVSSERDKSHSEKTVQEKSICFVVNSTNEKYFTDSFFMKFIKDDEFAQREIHNGYYRLVMTFYKKSTTTDALIKLKSSKYLDYCSDDIIVEYTWTNGMPTDSNYYQNGRIKGSEKIQIFNEKDSIK